MNEDIIRRLMDVEKALDEVKLPEEHRDALQEVHGFIDEIIESAKERRARAIVWGVWRNRLTLIGILGSAILVFRRELGPLLEFFTQ